MTNLRYKILIWAPKNMGSENFILICSIEVIAVLLFIIAILFMKNKKLQRLMNKLQTKMGAMKEKLKSAKKPAEAIPEPTQPQESYRDKLTQQLGITKEHHYDLGSRQDISLDLDPDSPLTRRTAALRHAFLIAEKEASSDATDEINWDLLATRYQQLLSYNEDYASTDDNDTSQEQLEQLEQAQKRIKNLERFKDMYFELEEKWSKCKNEADNHYTELKTIAANSDQQDNFNKVLDTYQATYQDIDSLIENGVSTVDEALVASTTGDTQSHELSRLRSVAADQHLIITDLQSQLSNASNAEEQLQIMGTMQEELQKQTRFLQESETCIQLMDNELTTANRELEQLRSKLKDIPQLKAALKELKDTSGSHQQITDSLKQENRRLAKKLKLALEAPKEDNQDTRQLRKELSALQANYNDLEERFLDLKLKD